MINFYTISVQSFDLELILQISLVTAEKILDRKSHTFRIYTCKFPPNNRLKCVKNRNNAFFHFNLSNPTLSWENY